MNSPFRDRSVAASLKRQGDIDDHVPLDALPRPFGRGLIEAFGP